jgi:hypothetical protein
MKEPWPTKDDVRRELLFAAAMWELMSLGLLACLIFGAGVALGAW